MFVNDKYKLKNDESIIDILFGKVLNYEENEFHNATILDSLFATTAHLYFF